MPSPKEHVGSEGVAEDNLTYDGDPFDDELRATTLAPGGPNLVERAIELASTVGGATRAEIERVAREVGLSRRPAVTSEGEKPRPA